MKKLTQDSMQNYLNAYNLDATGLSGIVRSNIFNKILPALIDYETFLKDRKGSFNNKKLIKKLSSRSSTIEVINNPKFREILAMAHLAVCCELFDGWNISTQHTQQPGFNAYIKQILEKAITSAEQRKILTTRVENSDAARTMHILRLLGLITTPSEKFRQISFGAEFGNREIDGLHMMPVIEQQVDMTSIAAASNQKLSFKKQIHKPEHVVLVDINPNLEKIYDIYTNNVESVIALNKGAEEAMCELAEMTDRNELLPLNLVASIRIDHRMIPDVKRFFHYLTPLLDETADFIFSIGAGYTVEEFQGRKKAMREIKNFLTLCGLKPISIVMHGGNSLEEARKSPAFGHISFTTYEIVYCKLIRKNLMKHR